MMKRLILFIAAALLMAVTAMAQLPSVKLKDLKGKTVDTEKIVNPDGPIIISFFATWCKPCLRELKAIAEVYDDWQADTGVKLIAVSIDDARSASKVKPLVDSSGWDYEVLLDTNSDFARAMGVRMVPHMVILDKKGKVVKSHSGYTDGSEDHIKELLDKMK